jgi:hypothetical protein
MPGAEAPGIRDPDPLRAALRSGGALAAAYEAFCESVWRQRHLPADVLELCRIRLVQLHGAGDALRVRHPAARSGPDIERRAASVLAGTWLRDGVLTEADCAALGFAELYAQGAGTITDEAALEVKRHFGERGLVALIEALGVIDGRIRLGLMIGRFLEA